MLWKVQPTVDKDDECIHITPNGLRYSRFGYYPARKSPMHRIDTVYILAAFESSPGMTVLLIYSRKGICDAAISWLELTSS